MSSSKICANALEAANISTYFFIKRSSGENGTKIQYVFKVNFRECMWSDQLFTNPFGNVVCGLTIYLQLHKYSAQITNVNN